MAELAVRALSFYWRDKKAATVNKVKVSLTMDRQPLVGQEGILAWSKGLAIMKLTVSGFIPVGGSHTTDDIERILNMDDIPISFFMGGKFYREKGAVTNFDADSDNEKGTLMEEVQISCKRPKIVG